MLCKRFITMLHNRLLRQLNMFQTADPAGFRKGFQTKDRPRACRLPNNSQEWELEMCMATVDFQKAFDSGRAQECVGGIAMHTN